MCFRTLDRESEERGFKLGNVGSHLLCDSVDGDWVGFVETFSCIEAPEDFHSVYQQDGMGSRLHSIECIPYLRKGMYLLRIRSRDY